MRPQKVLDTDVFEGLTKVFRNQGYEGASLQELAAATGLKKASLYHRFPKGKQEMAAMVLEYVSAWVEEHIFFELLNEENSPKIRLKIALENISTFYDHGNNVCLFRALSMQSGLELFENQINEGMQSWIDKFHQLGLAFGLEENLASKYATQALVEIQGSLIVCKGMNDLNVFKQAMQNIEDRYSSH